MTSILGLLPLTALIAATPTIDYLKWVTDTIYTLVTTHGDLFLADGRMELNWLALIGLLIIVIKWQLSSMDLFHHVRFHISDVALFLGKLAACSAMLYYYDNPLPGLSISFHQFFPALAKNLSSTLNQHEATDLLKYMTDLTRNLQKPNPLNLLALVVYFIALGQMAVMMAALFIIDSFGFLAVGILTLVGPLFIPLLLTKNFSRKFWQWLDMMIAYSMYRLIAAAFTYVWAHVLLLFFSNTIAGDYSFGNMIVLLPVMAMLTIAFVWSMLKVPAFTAELFGAGGVGASLAGDVQSFVRGLFY